MSERVDAHAQVIVPLDLDAVEAAIDHRVDDFDLPGGVDFERGRVPFHSAPDFTGRLDRAGMDRLPENMIGALGHDSDHALPASPASAEGQERG